MAFTLASISILISHMLLKDKTKLTHQFFFFSIPVIILLYMFRFIYLYIRGSTDKDRTELFVLY